MEKYSPSPEEIKKAENTMSGKQQELSRAREEGYKLAESKHSKAHTKENGPDKSFREQTTVNGVDIIVAWDKGYDDYIIYFPQIDTGEESYKKGITDQVLRIDQKPEVAKQVFDYASKLAQTESDVYDIYSKVEKFCQDLPHEDEE